MGIFACMERFTAEYLATYFQILNTASNDHLEVQNLRQISAIQPTARLLTHTSPSSNDRGATPGR